MQIRGMVRFPPGTPGEVESTRVLVQDITGFDGPATTVGSVELPRTEVPVTGMEVPFVVEVDSDLGDARRMYAVRAHADRTGSGEVEPGDLVTTTAYLVRGEDEEWPVLELQPVTG